MFSPGLSNVPHVQREGDTRPVYRSQQDAMTLEPSSHSASSHDTWLLTGETDAAIDLRNRIPAATIREAIAGPAPERTKPRAWYRLWWTDIVAILFSFATLGGSVLLLSMLDGKECDDCHVKSVQIVPNTLVSVIATFSKSALLLPVGEGLAQLKWRWSSLPLLSEIIY